jgi:hypothetical protein
MPSGAVRAVLTAKLDPAEVAPEEQPGAGPALTYPVAAGVDFDRAAVANAACIGAATADQKQQHREDRQPDLGHLAVPSNRRRTSSCAWSAPSSTSDLSRPAMTIGFLAARAWRLATPTVG